MPNKEKIGFVSLGCQKNTVDTEVMLGIIKNSNYELVGDERKADIVIINTCCFIEEARKEADEVINEFSELKMEGKIRKLIITGCLPQRYKEGLLDIYPQVDYFLGSSDFPSILEYVKGKEVKKNNKVQVSTPDYLYDNLTPRIITGKHHSVYVKVAEGCSEKCSFCIIPKLRGKYRSRVVDDIYEESKRLVGRGAKEINLLAQNLTGYGKDLKDGASLVHLLRKLCSLKDLKWIRLLYGYPKDFSDELIEVIASEEKICNYIDLPLQHIDDDILSEMKRDTTAKKIKDLLNKLKNSIENLVLRSSFIVGFPSENDKKFKALLSFIKEYEFDKIAVFPYSHEEGTSAWKYGDKISREVKLERYDAVVDIKKEVSERANKKYVGKTLDVIAENIFKENDNYLIEGRFYGQAPEVDGKVFVTTNKDHSSGDFMKADFTKSDEYDFYGIENR